MRKKIITKRKNHRDFVEIRKTFYRSKFLVNEIVKRIPVRRSVLIIKKYPFTSFLVTLLMLLGLIVLSNTVFSRQPTDEVIAPVVKKVDVYRIGEAPKVTFQAQVEKANVIKVSALNGGVIQAINFNEGNFVGRGQTLIVMSTNYQGGNALAVSRQISQTQYNHLKNTFDLQKEIISKQKDLANKQEKNADELRNITNQSISETNTAIDLNNDILSQLDESLEELEGTNINGQNDALILQTKQLKSQFLTANNQLKSSVRANEFSSSSDKPPTQMSDLQREIALKQLELQEKSLELGKEIARLQLVLAQVSEATMYPSAPFNSRIERIYVRVGQSVSPGTPLLMLSGESQTANLYVKLSKQIAQNVSRLEAAEINLGERKVAAYPDFISQEATDDNFFVIHFYLAPDVSEMLSDRESVSVDLKIGYPDTSGTIPFIPVDAIFQGGENSYVFVIKEGKAEALEVKLGQVLGSFVEIKSGLKSGDQVILDRHIVDSDLVESK